MREAPFPPVVLAEDDVAGADDRPVEAEGHAQLLRRLGDHLRGRPEADIFRHLLEGVSESGKNIEAKVIPESEEAIREAFKMAKKGDLVVILADTVRTDLEIVNLFRDEKLAVGQTAV